MLCTISGGEKAANRPVAPSRYRASFRDDSWCWWIFARQGQTSTLRAHWWPISAGGNLHWPTILATGWLIPSPTQLCHMTWQGHLHTCLPKYPQRRAVQHSDAVSVHLHSVNGQKRRRALTVSSQSIKYDSAPFLCALTLVNGEASSMRITAHHSRIASASVLQQASSALSVGNCSVATADLEATGVAVDIVRRRTITLARTLPVLRHPMGRFRRRERFQEDDHGSVWPRAALFTQNPAQLRLDDHRAALPGGYTSWTLPA
ncbi:hypothetical protein T07_3104 [Trichinella nelsoni]|uniref:Uncharacterized protein n=1 Tax=Trichinella nelsoni TaxID=6336 RepID=A0A0V0RF79_9BILA|nr:hypothetical protein T07_2070 [Trichinella nelsoni]KRX13152.1 hypothetical protein T07_3104 [Trichinella nelsoni]